MRRWGFNFPQLTDTTNLLFVTRRAAGKTNGLLLGGIIAGVAVLTLAGAWFLGGFSGSFRGIDKIDAAAYAESAKPFQGGTYQFEGVVDSDLGFERGVGRLIAFEVTSSNRHHFLPVLIPEKLSKINPQKGQSYRVMVNGRNSGLLVVEAIQKI